MSEELPFNPTRFVPIMMSLTTSFAMRRLILCVPLYGALVVSSFAQDRSIEERLRALENQVQKLTNENASLKKELGWKETSAPVLARPNGREAKFVIGGFLQGHAEFGGQPDSRWAGATGNDRFFFRRARLYVSGTYAEDFDFKAELDLQGNTLGGSTGNLARANEVFINWHRFAEANVRFGQLKPAFGAEQLLSDTRMVTIERSLSNDRLTDGRQMAVSVGGDLLDKKVSYLLVAGNGNGSNVSANDNNKFQRSARMVFSPLSSAQRKLAVGVNGLWSEDAGLARTGFGLSGNALTGKRAGVGADVAFTQGPLDLSAEWLQETFRPTNAVPDARFRGHGWHATAAYFLVPSKLQAVLRREAFDPNDRRSGDAVHEWLFGLNYFLQGEDIKLQVNYLLGDSPGTGHDGRLLTRVQLAF